MGMNRNETPTVPLLHHPACQVRRGEAFQERVRCEAGVE